jgi:hypothetical protein
MTSEERDSMIWKLAVRDSIFLLVLKYFASALAITALLALIHWPFWLVMLLAYALPLGLFIENFFSRKRKASGLSDEDLQTRYRDFRERQSRRNQIWAVAALAGAVALFATNPDEDVIRKRVGESMIPLSSVQRTNYYLFSVYTVRPPLSDHETKYMGILNQGLRLPSG